MISLSRKRHMNTKIDDKCFEVEQHRSDVLKSGFRFSVNGYTYQADETSRNNLMMADRLSASYPDGTKIMWLSADNRQTHLDRSDIQALLLEMGAFLLECYERSFILKDTIRSFAADEELDNFDIEKEWNNGI